MSRIPATTANENRKRVIRGFAETAKKGAGIRVYEYASSETIANCRLQLESLFWLCGDAHQVAVSNGMTSDNAEKRKAHTLAKCKNQDLFDLERLSKARIINACGSTVCPLCLEDLSAQGFFTRMEQAEGREVPDLTVTQLNLFHIEELRTGALNHRPYNVGWGHHHCNMVVKDSGIIKTLDWMRCVLDRNVEQCHLVIGRNTD